ncbi:hypothetical protein TgHK011_001860 [Trichoderma gracile]|nr:hypothetical protein TgHK011_001860 [Trichoderma gracile]
MDKGGQDRQERTRARGGFGHKSLAQEATIRRLSFRRATMDRAQRNGGVKKDVGSRQNEMAESRGWDERRQQLVGGVTVAAANLNDATQLLIQHDMKKGKQP